MPPLLPLLSHAHLALPLYVLLPLKALSTPLSRCVALMLIRLTSMMAAVDPLMMVMMVRLSLAWALRGYQVLWVSLPALTRRFRSRLLQPHCSHHLHRLLQLPPFQLPHRLLHHHPHHRPPRCRS